MKEKIIAILQKYLQLDMPNPDEAEARVAEEIDKLYRDDIDLAYCAGIFNTGGIDVLSKELERLKHINRKPHQIFQRYHSEDKLDKIDKRGGWICPRCQKVHSWLSMTCDCPPNVITASTIESKEVTEIKGENNCDNCIWGKCLTADWPCFDCDGSNKWEPIKTE